jgi:hypothetical protein
VHVHKPELSVSGQKSILPGTVKYFRSDFCALLATAVAPPMLA